MLKSELEEELRICGNANNDLKEELRIAKAANGTTNKALQDEKSEKHRLRKVLDRAITIVDSRLSVVTPLFRMDTHGDKAYRDNGPRDCSCRTEKETSYSEQISQVSDEQKFLQHLNDFILRDQFKPEKSDQFGRGFGSLY